MDKVIKDSIIRDIENDIKISLEAIYGNKIIVSLQVYSINGHVVEAGFKKHEISVYGSVKFGVLCWDSINVDAQGNEWVYGVEIGNDVINGKTRVYKLYMVNDVIVNVVATETKIPVKKLRVEHLTKRHAMETSNYYWLKPMKPDKNNKTSTIAVKGSDLVLDEHTFNGTKYYNVPCYKLIWEQLDIIASPGHIINNGVVPIGDGFGM